MQFSTNPISNSKTEFVLLKKDVCSIWITKAIFISFLQRFYLGQNLEYFHLF